MPTPVNPAASPLSRLQRLSRRMRALIALGAATLVVGSANSRLASEVPPDIAGLPTDTAVGLYALAVVKLLLALSALLQAWRLFGAYGRGQVFGRDAVRHLRRLAWTLIGMAVWQMLSRTLTVLLLTWHNPPGQQQLVVGVDWEDYVGVMYGALLIAMVWAMTEAGRLEQDNAGFV